MLNQALQTFSRRQALVKVSTLSLPDVPIRTRAERSCSYERAGGTTSCLARALVRREESSACVYRVCRWCVGKAVACVRHSAVAVRRQAQCLWRQAGGGGTNDACDAQAPRAPAHMHSACPLLPLAAATTRSACHRHALSTANTATLVSAASVLLKCSVRTKSAIEVMFFACSR